MVVYFASLGGAVLVLIVLAVVRSRYRKSSINRFAVMNNAAFDNSTNAPAEFAADSMYVDPGLLLVPNYALIYRMLLESTPLELNLCSFRRPDCIFDRLDALREVTVGHFHGHYLTHPMLCRTRSGSPQSAAAMDALEEFTVQAYRGCVVAVITQGMWAELDSNGRVGLILVGLSSYLNKCYLSMLREDDAYVVGVFNAAPEHSPVCILTTIVGMAQPIVERLIADLDAMDAGRVNVDSLRLELTRIITEILNAVQWKVKFGHRCSGMTAAQLRQEWAQNGRPEEQLITYQLGDGAGGAANAADASSRPQRYAALSIRCAALSSFRRF